MNKYWRLAAVILFIATLVIVGKVSGIADNLDRELLQQKMQVMGFQGFLIYLASFVGGVLVGVPGLLFIGLSGYAYGKVLGIMLAIVATVTALSASYWLIRLVGGNALAQIDKPFVKRMLARLESRPILTVCILRLTLLVSPPITYALALTDLRFRHYFIGTSLGVIPPITILLVFLEYLL